MPQTAPRALSGLRFPVAIFVIWRLAHLAVLRLAGGDVVDSAFQWDGGGYRRISSSGYAVHPAELQPPTAFFPLTSWLARIPDLLLPTRAAMVLTANVLALLAFVAVWGAARQWRDEQLARGSVLLLALWPPSLFLWAFYSEAGFVAASAGAVWADRRDRRMIAALLLGAAAMARPVGVTVAAVLVAVRVWRSRRVDARAVLYTAAGVAGLVVVMVAQHREAGDALAFLRVQEDWGRSLTFPWAALREGIGALRLGQPRLAKWLDLGGIMAMGFAVVWALWPRVRFRPGRRSLPIEAPLLTAAILAVPLCSGLLSSMSRYVLSAWPGFVTLADALAGARPRARWLVYGLLAVASVVLVRYWADGEFIG